MIFLTLSFLLNMEDDEPSILLGESLADFMFKLELLVDLLRFELIGGLTGAWRFS